VFDPETLALAESVLSACRNRGWHLATAESCTGGLVAAALTAIAGSSDVVERGFVTYSNEAKIEMLAVPSDLYESATIDGASPWQSFRFVTLPSVLPAVFVALIFRYIISFRLFSEVWLLTAGGPARTTEVMAIYLYKQSFTYASFGKGSATGWVMVMVSGLIAAAYLHLLYRRGFRQNA